MSTIICPLSIYADKVDAWIDKGQIIERGTHEELMGMNGWYHEQFIAQQMEDEKAVMNNG